MTRYSILRLPVKHTLAVTDAQPMDRKPIKTGREFEQLVACINTHLHKIAKVTPNDRFPDKDNGDPRQIDISVRLSDGTSNFLGIIEVRDRSRPVGIGYVEEVSAKRTSVGASSAWIVSKSGFWKSAKVKADALGIGLISYEQALKTEWSEFFHLMEGFGVQTRKFDKVKIFFSRRVRGILSTRIQSYATLSA